MLLKHFKILGGAVPVLPMKNPGVPKNGTDERRRTRTPGAEQGSVNIHRLIGPAILQAPCLQFADFKMPLAFSTYVKMVMYG